MYYFIYYQMNFISFYYCRYMSKYFTFFQMFVFISSFFSFFSLLQPALVILCLSSKVIHFSSFNLHIVLVYRVILFNIFSLILMFFFEPIPNSPERYIPPSFPYHDGASQPLAPPSIGLLIDSFFNARLLLD